MWNTRTTETTTYMIFNTDKNQIIVAQLYSRIRKKTDGEGVKNNEVFDRFKRRHPIRRVYA